MIAYRLEIADAHAHQFRVTLTVPDPHERQRLSLPVWIPGSYLVREFGRHLSSLEARQGGRDVPLAQLDKTTWEATTDGRTPLVVTYLVYAFDTSVRTAFLDARRGFFNGTSVALRVEGREAEPHRLELRALPRDWQVATSMPAVKVDGAGRGTYEAADYDELVDHPVELGRFWRGEFTAHGVPHEFVVAGTLPDFDGERLLADAKRVCEATIAFWHPDRQAPFERYVFMLNAVDDGYGGLEHRASTALIAARRDLPQRGKAEASDAYVTLLGLASHEYFHAWNVKRLRPREFARYDYTRENYTELLWFFEGFTSYYDDLLLRRAGLIDDARYLKLVAKTISGVQGMPGRRVQSVAQASFDAWVKYYRTDENTPNATISYYTKGALVALALDLTLRTEAGTSTGTPRSLDEVLRRLWSRSGGGPIAEADVREALADVAGRPLDDVLQAFVHGTDDLPLQPLLERFGVQWQAQPATLAQRLGLRVSETPLTGVKVTHVLRGGAAEQAGLSPGDELLAVEDWRLRRLDDALRLVEPGAEARVLLSRDQ
ncbi:MAG TPA: PDZ domain-containing protein, partial [Albitalea sp.]